MKKKYIYWFLAIAAFILLGFGIFAWMLFYSDMSYKITVSRETTYFTEPLLEDGTVDYNEAINRWMSEGITPETNAAIALMRLLGIDDTYRAHKDFHRFLGITRSDLPLPAFDRRLRGFTNFSVDPNDSGNDVEESGKTIYLNRPPNPYDIGLTSSTEYIKSETQLDNQRTLIAQGPWRAEDYPYCARWIERNAEVLAQLAAISRMPHYYLPDLEMKNGEMYPSIFRNNFDTAIDCLAARVMLRIGQSDLDGAVDDVLTIKRFSKFTALEYSVKYRITRPLIALFSDPKLSDEQCGRLTEGLAAVALEEAKNIEADKTLQLTVRLQWIQDFPLKGIHDDHLALVLSSYSPPSDPAASPTGRALRNTLRRRVDWDRILTRYQKYLADLNASNNDPNRVFRFDDEKKIAKRHFGDEEPIVSLNLSDLLFSVHPTEIVWRYIGYCETNSSFDIFDNFVYGNHAERRLIEIARRLARHRAACGEFPEQLGAILDGTDDAWLIEDPFNGTSPFHYVKDPDGEPGYTLYSIGPDGTDDGGEFTYSLDSLNIYVSSIPGDIGYRVGSEGLAPPTMEELEVQQGSITPTLTVIE